MREYLLGILAVTLTAVSIIVLHILVWATTGVS